MRTVWLFIVIVLPLLGCGPKSLFPIEPVEGVVTLDGETIEGATVNFTPNPPGVGMAAAGRTNAQGVYKLTAFSGGLPEKGTKIGGYDITIILDRRAREITPAEVKILEDGGFVDIPIINVVPRRYNDSATSGLSAEVVKGKNVFNFDLKTKEQ